MIEKLRNVAIVAHVDHGKTTLVDRLLQQSGTLERAETLPDRAMDSNDIERERGITILSKNTAIEWQDYRINIVDTPGHADFGGEVERVLSMVDAFVLLVDAVDGPMPQTRFVCQKAFSHGLKPIVVINKIDRPGARPDWVLDQTFDLLDHLGADEDQLDFPVVYASALNGWANMEPEPAEDMQALFKTLVEEVPPPAVDPDSPLQMQVTSLDYSSYLGAIAIGRIRKGTMRKNSPVVVVDRDGKQRRERIMNVFGFMGLERVEVEEASAGDIVAFSGMDFPRVSDTVCDPEHPEAMKPLTVDEPTISMTFETNTSPFAGKEGKYVTSRQVRERLLKETIHNVALKVEETADPEKFKVSGRGELHLSILLENMRRESYELAVSRPEVIVKEIDGVKQEPWELLTVDLEEATQGAVMEALGERGGQLENMAPDGKGRVRLDYKIPARGLIGFQTDFRTLTSGTGIMHHVFDQYGPLSSADLGARRNGAIISNGQGKAVGFALFNLQDRGKLFVSPGDPVYEGQVIGIHARENDLTVNPQKAKQLTNVRASGKDDAIQLTPPINLTLEQALEFINDDELIEVTPGSLRVRKRWLTESDRKKASRKSA
ncbi:translational GTPase TypA [Natronospira proteinivora]|uniref:translational GTPase TypA n=1 Tax=Natronospira proteinivora TaxID=1807133 RepID=UPI00209C8BE1